ncbi:MAG: DUF11 domain-containing protein [Anaerolineae bacterium]|nr:DUF11 domain-containing protein [Anaerolineae bacterium]
MKIKPFRLWLPFLLAALALALPLLAARADTLVVTKTADTDDGICDADCSLREAVAIAGSGDTITFDAGLSGQTLVLESEMVISKTLTLDGSALAAHARISGNDAVRVFYVADEANVTLFHLDVISGNATGNGGGIYSTGALTLANCTVSGSHAADYGGGIYNRGALTLLASTLSGNNARYGGGLFNSASGVGMINSSALNGNVATVAGGGIYNTGGVVSVTASTLSGNHAASLGGGIDNTSGGTVSLIASTVASNTSQTGGGLYNLAAMSLSNSLIGDNGAESGPDCNGALTSQDYNLIESTADCTFGGVTTHNITGQDALLGPLNDNGGATPTQALLADSPALDRIPVGANGCGDNPAQDQRGSERPSPSGGACDIGAYERRVSLAVSKSVTPAHDVPDHGVVTYTLSLHNTGEGEESHVVLSDTLPGAVDFAAWIVQPAGATATGDVIAWEGALAAGESLTFTFGAAHVGDPGDIVTNTLNVNSAAGDSNAGATFTVEMAANEWRIYLPLILK